MVVVFSTAGLTADDRVAATCAAMQEQSVPSTVRLEDTAHIESRMDVWTYGDTSIFRAEMTGFRLIRTQKQISSGPGEMLAIAVHERCVGKQEQFGVQRLARPDELMLMDLNSTYDYALNGVGASRCLHVPVDAIGLPHEVVRAAADRLPASPLYRMLVNHISELTVHAEELTTSSAARTLGESSIELTRTLLASAYDLDYARGAMAELLLPRVRAYVKQHLADPDLSPSSIAAAHGISPRHLFKLCAAAEFSLEQWIIAERLTRARDELARPDMRSTPVAAIARRWGFVNDSHFSRRFRMMYGASPRAWRQMNSPPTAVRPEQVPPRD
ncbi:helix-turn-helix domain-containing protein [Gordonia insulae]|uniref:Transcriptional activator NphR n=1 Tax=Gordonia insulae TaxID=2420509 RepID=A0A3G8JHV0_9ACTN|nr:helix-turn-helix domain-containing protein [Gordonia insulae]AZG44478.1 Transcriptional activator NphR [Gordonia insulae]